MSQEKTKQLIFSIIVIGIIGLLIILIIFRKEIINNILWIALLIAFIIIMRKGNTLLKLSDFERAVIFRFGKVKRVGGPGWAVVLPLLEDYKIVDTRTQTIDINPQDVITKDGIELKIDALIYLSVKRDKQSIINSVVNVKDYKQASKTYVMGVIRDIAGSMELTQVISEVEKMNSKLKKELTKISQEWGIKVDDVQIKDVNIPPIVLEAMHKEKAALQDKMARMHKAEAKKFEIEKVKEAAKNLDDKTISYYYIKALEKMSQGKASKIIFPIEIARLAENISGRIGGKIKKEEIIGELMEKYEGVIKEFLKKKKEKTK